MKYLRLTRGPGSWLSIGGALVVLLTGCSAGSGEPTVPGRWYTPQQVSQGEQLFNQYCVACHQQQAVGTLEWKKRDAAGNLPPPPLNGTAHAWHHDLPLLMRIIDGGGARFGGTMPPFGQLLDDDQKRAVIAYFQSFWSEPIYRSWSQR